MKNIHLIRHAQSISNAWLPTDHPKTVPLTKLWKYQAQQLADNRETEPDVIVYSTYDRTYETAKPLIQKYPHTQIIQSELIHEFTYLDAAKYKWTTWPQRAWWRKLFRDNPDVMYKDSATSESIYDLFTRIDQTIPFLQSLYGKEVVVFSHWQFIYTLIQALQDQHFLTNPHAKQYLWKHTVEKDHGIENASIHTITHLLKR